MIALSSYAPFDRSTETEHNQLAAKRSWEGAFSQIVYFNALEPRLVSAKTSFTGHLERPRIREMAEFAAAQDGWVAIINADIVVARPMERLDSLLNRQRVWCGISRRLQFEPNGTPKKGRLVDLGLDFFFARPSVWALVASEIPDQFIIGKQLWDTWVLSFFLIHAGEYCVDATAANMIWHPRHGARGDFSMEPPPGDTYLDRVRWPRRRLAT